MTKNYVMTDEQSIGAIVDEMCDMISAPEN